jgi:hypothetical protein
MTIFEDERYCLLPEEVRQRVFPHGAKNSPGLQTSKKSPDVPPPNGNVK